MSVIYSFEQFLSARSAYGPVFDASGKRIYFIADITGAPGLWGLHLDVPRGWPEPLAVQLDRVQWVSASSRPGRVAIGADDGGNERTQLYLLEGVGRMPRPLTDRMEAIHMFGGWHPDGASIAFSSNERDPHYFDVHLMDVDTGERRVAFRRDGTYYAGPISPDGVSLVVQEVRTPSEQALWLLDLRSGEVSQLTEPGEPSRYQHPAWSADGRSIYCVSDHGRDFLALALIDVETGRLSPVAEAAWDVDDFALTADGRRLIYEVNAGGRSEVWVRELEGGRVARLELPMGQAQESSRWCPTFSWSPDGSRYALTLSTPTAPAEIFVGDAGESAPARVTGSWAAGLRGEDLVEPELVRYSTFDGRDIPAYVFRPTRAREGPCPCVFFVHGGPESQTRTAFNSVIQYFVHRGLAVVAPNVRGSSGYGNAYGHLDDVERRMDSVRDLAAGAAWAAQLGLADGRRIAVMGASYGGFMVLAALTEFPALWAAGVDIVGIANFVTFLERTGPWRRHLREAEYGSLEHHRDLLERISPIHKVDRIAAPLMVIHGANDPRVPVSETEQIVASLRERGRPVEYLRFEDEGHGLVKLRNRLLAYPRIADFLDAHLGRD